jgi:glycerophosphoryl diester phosphodiesterase
MRRFATGVGPALGLLQSQPSLVADAHAASHTVVPYTFRARRGDREAAAALAAAMRKAVEVDRVDALFTDNPDLFPRPRQ